MKIFILFTISFIFIFCTLLQAQPQKGDWELSLSGYLGSMKNIYKYSSPYGSDKSEGEAQEYCVVAFRPGYFINNQVEVESEFLFHSFRWEGSVQEFLVSQIEGVPSGKNHT